MESQDNETVVIECASRSARFAVNKTSFVSIKGLHFIGCGSNIIYSVEDFIVEDTIFQGVEGEGRGTALVLGEVAFAKITKSSFNLNTPGNNSQRHYVREFVRDRKISEYYLELRLNDLVSVGGALLTTSSNITVTDTKFVLNTAELGGVLLAYQSNITITQCTFSYNRAHYGGVMFTVQSSVTFDNSMFSNNAAEEDVNWVDNDTFDVFYSGGVVISLDGSLNVISSIFTNNTATYGGVMLLYH